MDIGRVGIRGFWAFHKLLDRLTRGRFDTRRMGLPSLFLTTVGRKSGERRENALFYTTRGDDLVVSTSNAGDEHPPAWWLNLQANPETEVRIRTRRFPVVARQATPEEETVLWPAFEAAVSNYARYRRNTDRHIDLVVLEPRRADDAAANQAATRVA